VRVSQESVPLRKGYTTGVHTVAAFGMALEGLLATKMHTYSCTKKMDNDDLDVTKGCEITVALSYQKEDLVLNPIEHKPYMIGNLRLYAGEGVGIVTKDGLKPPQGYPAINPVPLREIKERYDMYEDIEKMIYATVSVTDGEELAKQTANAKVGVLGGISILGTTGFVKPISTAAYLDSIAVEMGFAKANGYDMVVFTLGNSSLLQAKMDHDEAQIIEIGNFIYDALKIAEGLGFTEVIFYCGIGKAVKVMQGYKNTHNRFGDIDFGLLKEQVRERLSVEIDTKVTKTVKGITAQLGEQKELFFQWIAKETEKQIKEWFPKLGVTTEVVR